MQSPLSSFDNTSLSLPKGPSGGSLPDDGLFTSASTSNASLRSGVSGDPLLDNGLFPDAGEEGSKASAPMLLCKSGSKGDPTLPLIALLDRHLEGDCPARLPLLLFLLFCPLWCCETLAASPGSKACGSNPSCPAVSSLKIFFRLPLNWMRRQAITNSLHWRMPSPFWSISSHARSKLPPYFFRSAALKAFASDIMTPASFFGPIKLGLFGGLLLSRSAACSLANRAGNAGSNASGLRPSFPAESSLKMLRKLPLN
mmetsp:Transcript_121862/g.260107  ORF Transcript_121862/g.260107 Transcript_121862/m.260107 type:complete len:256 (-) Transcript_121862:165-932(-)